MQYNIHVDVPVNQTLTEQINFNACCPGSGAGIYIDWMVDKLIFKSALDLVYLITLFGKHAFAGPGCIPCRPHARDIKIASGCYTNFTNI